MAFLLVALAFNGKKHIDVLALVLSVATPNYLVYFFLNYTKGLIRKKVQQWYFVIKIVLTYCEKKLF
jgi:hypothetical protein